MAPPAWLAAAWREHGTAEFSGSRHNSRIIEYARRLGAGWVRDDETPWCAAFVGACLEAAGMSSTRSMRARSYEDWGQALPTPVPGAVVVLSRGSNPRQGHVGFFFRRNKGSITLLGGNQGNRVSVADYPVSRLVAVRWPSDHPVPAGGAESEAFLSALSHVLEQEGGWSDDPHDPGGATNKGVTLKVYARHRGQDITDHNRDRLVAALKNISHNDVREIYFRNYWRRCWADEMPLSLGLMHFDCAVNQGPARAARFLQAAVGAEVDGEIGPLTIARTHRCDQRGAVQRYAEQRRRHYRGLGHFWRFGRGWLARTDRTLNASLKLVGSAADRSMEDRSRTNAHEGTTHKVENKYDMSQSMNKPKWWGESLTIWGSFITALSTILPLVGPFFGLDITSAMIEQFGAQVADLIKLVGGIVGTLMTIYGRLRASTRLVRRSVTLNL